MQRLTLDPRPDWRESQARLGFDLPDTDGVPYWDEDACWRFTAAEIDVLDDATTELERLCRLVADHAVRHGLRTELGLSERAWALVVRSWEQQEASLYGRMDLRWDGTGPPLLLEYNADTPTALFEASVVQWDWMVQRFPEADQFNSLHEALIATWAGFATGGTVHFTCARDSIEDRTTTDYLRDTAIQAGIATSFLHVDEIGWNGRHFVDLDEALMQHVFKLYPWDWLCAEAFGEHLAGAPTRWLEPAWRMILASKGVLALLWELFPGHPNLLPAFREPGRTGGLEISKPFWGREGANIQAPFLLPTPGPYTTGPRLYQEWAELPCIDGRYPVLGSWLIGGVAHGMGIREDSTPITRDTSRFVPHVFDPAPAEGPSA